MMSQPVVPTRIRDLSEALDPFCGHTSVISICNLHSVLPLQYAFSDNGFQGDKFLTS
jgi:hypothetical protein